MISFELSDEQAIAQSTARKLAETSIRPVSRSLSAFRDVPFAQPISDPLLERLASLGLVQSVALSPGAASVATSRLISTLILEQLAWGDANCALAVAAPLGFVRAIAEQGSGRQRGEILPSFTHDGYRAAAVAAAEPGLSSNGLKGLSTELTRTKSGYVLNGRKALVPMASKCTHFLVIARQGGDLRAVIVPADAEGVRIDESRYTMGCAASDMRDVIFTQVDLGASAVLGEENSASIQRLIDGSWVATSAILTGLTKAAYEFIFDYVKERQIAGQPLGTKQAVAIRIVDMFSDSESMRWMGWRAAARVDSNDESSKYARLAHGRAIDVAGWVVDEALQFMGGHGLMADHLMESWYRNTKTVSTLEMCVGS